LYFCTKNISILFLSPPACLLAGKKCRRKPPHVSVSKQGFLRHKNGLSHTGTLGVTQTGICGVTHTDFLVQEERQKGRGLH
jgi:hypothetical protein